MREIWRLHAEPVVPSRLKIETVLVEYNGPQIVTFSDQEGLKLGVAADDDEEQGIVRWICVPISNTEFKALVGGALAIRDVLLKADVQIVDINSDGIAVRSWKSPSEHLDESMLPQPGALLPKATRSEFSSELLAQPELCLERPGMSTEGLPFSQLAKFLNTFQRFWRAVATVVMPENVKENATLALAGVGTGSLILKIVPYSQEAFNAVSHVFEELALAGDDFPRLRDLMSDLGSDVQAQYVKLLKSVADQELQLLVRHAGGAAFLASYSATRVVDKLREVNTAPAGGILNVTESQVQGYFVSFDVETRAFGFHDSSAKMIYRGQAHLDALSTDDRVVVGSGVRYVVVIRDVSVLHGSDWIEHEYELVQARQLRDAG